MSWQRARRLAGLHVFLRSPVGRWTFLTVEVSLAYFGAVLFGGVPWGILAPLVGIQVCGVLALGGHDGR